MSTDIESFRRNTAELRKELNTQVDGVLAGSDEGLTPLRDFLFDELLTHARGEERHFYPAVGPMLCAEGTAMATMTMDHVAIERYVDRFAGLLADQPRDRVAIERALVALQALVELHLDKEEQLLLPTLERNSNPATARAVLQGVEALSSRD